MTSWQEYEAADHTAFSQEAELEAGVHLTFKLLLSLGPQPKEFDAVQLWWAPQSQLIRSRDSFQTRRGLPPDHSRPSQVGNTNHRGQGPT